MKTLMNFSGLLHRKLEKSFQIPSDYLPQETTTTTASWQRCHRKPVQINPVSKGKEVCFIWKTLS